MTDFKKRNIRLLEGEAIRDKVPRKNHKEWDSSSKTRSVIDILEESNKGRLQELVPIRYGRMLQNPFTFLRGSAVLMAHDLASTPASGIPVQACGDCHLMNFGLFATPERNQIFDINDFDETLPAPWEWDLKRLAVSFVTAGRYINLTENEAKNAAEECARAYRVNLRKYSKMSPLEVWYDKIDAQMLVNLSTDSEMRKRREKISEEARKRSGEYLFPKISTKVEGKLQLIDQPPLLYHLKDTEAKEYMKESQAALDSYRLSLQDDRRVLFDRYKLEDIAIKVVGIGSVGTRCFIALFISADNQPILLQFKQSSASVLEPYAGNSIYKNHGQRIVSGQRIMQSSSDIFLGWTRSSAGYDYYGRQLRDMKYSAKLEGGTAKQLKIYAELCGWTLARAHARSGDAALISGYLGKSDTFDQAIAQFAEIYADQNEKDYNELLKAVKTGRIKAILDNAK